MTRTYEIAVAICTFGSKEWEDQGDWLCGSIVDQRIEPSLIRVHLPRGTLSESRNEAIRILTTDHAWEEALWLILLDADDELDPGFVEALAAYQGDADILQTAVRGFRDHVEGREWLDPVPVLHKQKYPLSRQNFLGIGSPIRATLFEKVGGFDEWPVLEDYAFFLKAYNAGAKFDELYDAVYNINDAHSRNLNPLADDIARQIRATYS